MPNYPRPSKSVKPWYRRLPINFKLLGMLAVAFIIGAGTLLVTQQTLVATDQSSFCGNCHVMGEAQWTHAQSVHSKQSCNECHIPHDNVVSMLVFKGLIGTHDVFANTFFDIDDRIQADKASKDVIQANCVRCHYATIKEVDMTVKEYCTDCHRSIPHMKKLPIDRRKAADV